MNKLGSIGFRTTLSISVSLLTGAGMLFSPVWWLTIFGVGIWLYVLHEHIRSRTEALVNGFILGFCTAGAGLISLLEILPPGSSENILASAVVMGLLWFIPTFFLSLPMVGVAWVIYALREKTPIFVLFPFLLLLSEEAKMWLWTLISYGKGAIIEPHLSISAIAYALADNPLTLSFASIAGLSSLTFLLGLLSSLLALAITTSRSHTVSRQVVFSGFLIVLTTCTMSAVSYTNAQRETPRLSLSVLVVNSYYGSDTFTPIPIDTSVPPPDVFLLPEGKKLDMVVKDADTVETWLSPSLTVRSTEGRNSDGARVHQVLYERDGEVVASHEKHFIMPYGEYIPLLSHLFINTIPQRNIRSIESGDAVTHGTSLSSAEVGNVRIGALLCSEIFSPHLYSKLHIKHGAKILVNLADPVWFNGSRLLYAKTKQVAKVHAMQNNAYLIVAQNSAPSFAITPNGELMFETPWNKSEAVRITL